MWSISLILTFFTVFVIAAPIPTTIPTSTWTQPFAPDSSTLPPLAASLIDELSVAIAGWTKTSSLGLPLPTGWWENYGDRLSLLPHIPIPSQSEESILFASSSATSFTHISDAPVATSSTESLPAPFSSSRTPIDNLASSTPSFTETSSFVPDPSSSAAPSPSSSSDSTITVSSSAPSSSQKSPLLSESTLPSPSISVSQAASPSSLSPSSPSPSLSSSAAAYLDPHNTLRAKHGASPLSWSDKLAAAAQTWADKCQWAHSSGAVGPFGENIAAGTGSFDAASAVAAWAAEEPQYNPSNPQASHYTQMVWKGTTELGCAVASCPGLINSDVAQFHVCEYNPPGNVIGEFTQNVDA